MFSAFDCQFAPSIAALTLRFAAAVPAVIPHRLNLRIAMLEIRAFLAKF
jgi:hypothetical protein